MGTELLFEDRCDWGLLALAFSDSLSRLCPRYPSRAPTPAAARKPVRVEAPLLLFWLLR